jgi:phosphoglycolate phosphatase
MEMAQAAQLRSIGVGWGYHQTEPLMAAGAQRVVQTVDQLRDCVRSTLGE